VVVVALEPALTAIEEAVADRMAEQAALRIMALVEAAGALALLRGAGDHRAVVAEDRAPVDLQLLQQGAPVDPLFLQRLRVEHRPVGRKSDQHREHQHDQAVELCDLGVHVGSGTGSPSAAPASWRRARSEIKSNSASSTKLATIELPP